MDMSTVASPASIVEEHGKTLLISLLNGNAEYYKVCSLFGSAQDVSLMGLLNSSRRDIVELKKHIDLKTSTWR